MVGCDEEIIQYVSKLGQDGPFNVCELEWFQVFGAGIVNIKSDELVDGRAELDSTCAGFGDHCRQDTMHQCKKH